MKCPICTAKLIEVGPGARSCPNRHGLLVTAKVLKEAYAYVIKADITDTDEPDSPLARVIHCPNCMAQMMVIDYAGLGIMIDACFSCDSRWLDAGEMTKIMERTRRTGRLNPAQLLALEGLSSALRQSGAENEDD